MSARSRDEHGRYHPVEAPGDGFVTCGNGHRHWGTSGAAGLLAFYRDETGAYRYMLVKRAPWIHNPGKWSTPSGAIVPGEAPIQAVVREANEEGFAAVLATGYIAGVAVSGCPGWPFYTVMVRVPFPAVVPTHGAEHTDLDWVTKTEAEKWLDLQPGMVLPA